MEFTRDPLTIRQPALPRPVRALPVQLWPADCPTCGAPVPDRASVCVQCGQILALEQGAEDGQASFSLS